MTEIASRLDDYGKPAWIALTVLGFILFWPIGLALLIYTIWSGRMGCGAHGYGYGRHGAWSGEDRRTRWERKMARMQEKMAQWGERRPSRGGFAPTGNRAFDEYRDQMMQRLEDEAQEFQAFLARLRMARDKEEFDNYMADRQKRDQNPPTEPPAQPPRSE